MYGNRGCLHDPGGRLVRSYNGRRWIACRLQFRGRRRGALMQPGRYTELFFLDEATAMAAGHRPCAECRRPDYNRFRELWAGGEPLPGAGAIDARLHAERVDLRTRTHRLHAARFEDLPDGAFALVDGAPWLVWGPRLHEWSAAGYGACRPRPSRGSAILITPPSLVSVLRLGWQPEVPLVHPTALA